MSHCLRGRTGQSACKPTHLGNARAPINSLPALWLAHLCANHKAMHFYLSRLICKRQAQLLSYLMSLITGFLGIVSEMRLTKNMRKRLLHPVHDWLLPAHWRYSFFSVWTPSYCHGLSVINRPVLKPSYTAEDWRSNKRLQVILQIVCATYEAVWANGGPW